MKNNAFWIILQRLRTPLLVIIFTYSISILGMVLIPGLDDQGNIYHLTFFDAFYFISYTASTIGFGETPYDFTYDQRLWVLVCIYLTVVGWFYAIGTLVTVLSDKTLKYELMRGKFRKQVKALKSDFVIVLGYNYINSQVIKKLLENDMAVVLVDISEEKINLFLLEDFAQSIPIMVADALLSETLKDAGIERENCRAVISHFFKEDKNLRIAVFTRFLNPNVKVVTKATMRDILTSLVDTDIAKVENPFEIFAKRLDIALTAPHIMILENWIYKNHDLTHEATFLPQGRYIICGYGRMGKAIKEKLDIHSIDYVIIDENILPNKEMIENDTFIYSNADDSRVLLDAGIEEASVLIVGTQNDIDNISIIITAQKLNPNLYIIARENTMKEVSVFEAADIDWLFMIEQILINKTSLQLANPLKHIFLKLIIYKDEEWGTSLVNLLKSQIGANPKLMNLTISEDRAYALYHEIKMGEKISINILLKSLKNWKNYHNAIPLLLKRGEKKILLPHDDIMELGDQILFACDEESREEIEYIASNIYDLHYIRTGEEKKNWALSKIFKS
jgi:Trk K+ transport system NAD-binding subunit